MNYYLPKCCRCWWDNGKYVVGHNEHSEHCKHAPSGGKAGYPDKATCCNRILGHGKTKAEAVADARGALGLD